MRRIAGFMVVGALVAVLGCDATSPVNPPPVKSEATAPDGALVFASVSVGLSHVCGVTTGGAAGGC